MRSSDRTDWEQKAIELGVLEISFCGTLPLIRRSAISPATRSMLAMIDKHSSLWSLLREGAGSSLSDSRRGCSMAILDWNYNDC